MDIIYRYDPFEPLQVLANRTADDAERSLREGNLRYQEMVSRIQSEIVEGGAAEPVVIPSSPLSLGVSLVPRLAHTVTPPGVTIIPLTGDPPKRHVFAACRGGAESNPGVRAVLDAVIEVAT